MEAQKKRCCQCDFIVEENINFCPYCGSNKFENVDKNITMKLKPEDSPWYKSENSSVKEVPKNSKILNVQEFYEQYVSKGSKSWIVWFLVINFASAALSLPSLLTGIVVSVVDIVVYLLIGIVVLRKKSWIAALIGAIYSGLGSLLSMIVSQQVVGIPYMIVAIMAMRKLRKLQTGYREYTISGKVPDMEI